MRRIALLFLPCLAAFGGPWTFEGESAHYSIQSTAEKKVPPELLRYMDLCFETYRKFLKPAPERLPRQKFQLILYRDKKEYRASGGRGRYGHYERPHLVGFAHPEQMLPTFAHEGMHQFTDICIPNFHRLPPWYAEGIAECIANNEVRQGKLYMCLKKGPVPKIRAYVVRDAIRSDKFIRLRDLLTADDQKFEDNWKLYYAASWLFCHFLLTYPKLEDPARQIPEGKYKHVIVKLHNAMLDPKTRVDEAVKHAFVGENNKPLNLDELEKEFREYALSFEAERPADDP